MTPLTKSLLVWLARLAVSGTLLAAGVLKLADLAQTQQAVAGYRLLPEVLLWPATLLLPWAEIIGALGLLWPATRRAAQGWLALLLLLFLAAILAAWARGLDIFCGCFGGTGPANYPWLVLRDLGLLALLGISRWKSPPTHHTSP